MGQDANRTATDGAIADVDRFRSVLVQIADIAAFGARLGRYGVFSFNQVPVIANVALGRVPAIKVKNVGHDGVLSRMMSPRFFVRYGSRCQPAAMKQNPGLLEATAFGLT